MRIALISYEYPPDTADGRGVIGSSAGGMLEDGKYGLNVAPHRASALSEAIGSLLADPARRIALGQAAREKVLSAYTLERIGTLQEESYRRAIERRHRLGPRIPNLSGKIPV